jgi:hypothetical protein
MKNNIKYRKDITDHIMELLKFPCKKSPLLVYEIKGELYGVNWGSSHRIEFFVPYSIYMGGGMDSIKKEIEDKFSVKFAEKGKDLICKCGESEKFSASYGRYEFLLKCNSCGHKFSAYSG